MASSGPQKISVKRKRDDVPVETLIMETNETTRAKRAMRKDGGIIWRLVNDDQKRISPRASSLAPRLTRSQPATPRPHSPSLQEARSSGTVTPRIFHLSRGNDRAILVEKKGISQPVSSVDKTSSPLAPLSSPASPVLEGIAERTPKIRKLPGRSTVTLFRPDDQIVKRSQNEIKQPSEDVVHMLEQFAEDIAKKEAAPVPARKQPMRFKPRAPALRYKDRHPEKADAMNIDNDDYVYDTYYREEVMQDADGPALEPSASVGIIVIEEDDEELWDGYGEEEEESDRVYTDDEDENAEDYYANDYPEDELDSEDEFGTNPYRYHHGSDQEEYDAVNDPWSDDDVDALDRDHDFRDRLNEKSPLRKLHLARPDEDHNMEVL
ncbi:uncharacterized protein BDR25DRAFT_1064 [Lindgomyces ingoldianus]|uniref:Uncharacterized protein n=1 Tax=Lindgomyces ingoldianus TaxID=673940 RepID=A0ACB6RE51_9PLEO|nr:uncharacterized protein BDR25DRAFT_1064 [Lindgomyces ingoldianus]KAF2477466.1 hypothetical protein BDR25DRAFT_1064 [Lindgomyces ingoldianus]